MLVIEASSMPGIIECAWYGAMRYVCASVRVEIDAVPAMDDGWHLPRVAAQARASRGWQAWQRDAQFSRVARPPLFFHHGPSTRKNASSDLPLSWRFRSRPRTNHPSSKTIITRAASAASMMR
jgi:hypothetical protein